MDGKTCSRTVDLVADGGGWLGACPGFWTPPFEGPYVSKYQSSSVCSTPQGSQASSSASLSSQSLSGQLWRWAVAALPQGGGSWPESSVVIVCDTAVSCSAADAVVLCKGRAKARRISGEDWPHGTKFFISAHVCQSRSRRHRLVSLSVPPPGEALGRTVASPPHPDALWPGSRARGGKTDRWSPHRVPSCEMCVGEEKK